MLTLTLASSSPGPLGKPAAISSLIYLLISLLLPHQSSGQHLEALGAQVSLAVTQTMAKPYFIDMGTYTLNTQADPSNLDEIGYRLSAYGRWRVSQSHFFVQPEVAYTSTMGQAYEYSSYPAYYYPLPGPYGPDYGIFSHHISRWEVAALAGLHTGRRTYLMLGPVVALNLQEKAIATKPSYPHVEELYNSLNASVLPMQLLAQAGIGITFGRLDFNLRYEQSLTPYTRRFTFDGATYRYEQQIRQGLFTAGFLLYKRKMLLER